MKRPVIALIDYGIGNVRSIANALSAVGADPLLTRDRRSILSAQGVVLPGVGAFAAGMANLRKYHLTDIIERLVGYGKPFLGICLGMQMLFDESDEFGLTKGLGLVPGRVERLPVNEKLPHVGWNDITPPEGRDWRGTILAGLRSPSPVYFGHSFAAVPKDPAHILAATRYGSHTFTTAIAGGAVYGCQFHPEKSARIGLEIMTAFVCLSDEKRSNDESAA